MKQKLRSEFSGLLQLYIPYVVISLHFSAQTGVPRTQQGIRKRRLRQGFFRSLGLLRHTTRRQQTLRKGLLRLLLATTQNAPLALMI
jgi:hypothetical protein